MITRGFVGTIVLIIIAIVFLKLWLGFDIFRWLNTPEVKTFFFKIWDIIRIIWERYLENAVRSLIQSIKVLFGITA